MDPNQRNRPYRNILPAAPSAPGEASGSGESAASGSGGGGGGGGGPGATRELPRRKRVQVATACDACRLKKTACNGQRPRCSACIRRGSFCLFTVRRRTSAETPEQTAARADSERRSGEALRQLRDLPEDQALDLLHSLRRGSDVSALAPAATSASAGQAAATTSLTREALGASGLIPRGLSEFEFSRNLLSPTQNGLQFELMVRHAVAYPPLFPIRLASLPLEKLLRPVLIPHQQRSLATSSEGTPQSSDPSAMDTGQSPATSTSTSSLPPRPLVDDRLNRVDVKYWTKVPIAGDLAIRVISLYLEVDFPVFPLFQLDLFLDDLVNQRPYFCSRFLVASLLCWACLAYTAISPETAPLSVAFFAEAEALWTQETSAYTLTSAAGIQLLSMAATCYGSDDLAVRFLQEGVRIGKRMGLFGVSSEVDSAGSWLDDNTEWRRAASYTAWGIFNWVSMRCLHFQRAEVESSPLIPKPGDPSLGLDPHGRTAPPVFEASCELWTIFNDVVWQYYGTRNGGPAKRAKFEFAEETYHRLLSWADALPLTLARGDQNDHSVTLLHIFFHAVVADVFRPFLQSPQTEILHLKSFATPAAVPEAVYAASIDQLKRLFLIYRLNFRESSPSVLWQTAAVYVANAMVHEARTSGNPEWRLYLRMCLAELEDLSACFRAFRSVAQGLMGMALRQGALTADETGRIAGELRELEKNHAALEAPGAGGLDGDIDAKWIVDLDLAMTDPDAAQGTNLAERFQEMSLMENYTTGGSEGDAADEAMADDAFSGGATTEA